MAFSSLTLLCTSLSYHSSIKLIDKITNWEKNELKKTGGGYGHTDWAQSSQHTLENEWGSPDPHTEVQKKQKHVEMPEASVCLRGRSLGRALLKAWEVPARDSEPRLWSMDSGTTVRQRLPLCFASPKTCPKGPWDLTGTIVITRLLFVHTLQDFALSVGDGDL